MIDGRSRVELGFCENKYFGFNELKVMMNPLLGLRPQISVNEMKGEEFGFTWVISTLDGSPKK